MDALSPVPGNSLTVVQAGAQQRTNIPATGIGGGISAGLSMTVNGTLNCYVAAEGSFAGFQVGDVVDVANFTSAANNGRKRVTQVTSTQLFVSDTGLVDATADIDASISRMRLPSYILVTATTAVPKFNLWTCDGGTPPLAASALFLGAANPMLFLASGYDQFVTDGASGSVSVTPLSS